MTTDLIRATFPTALSTEYGSSLIAPGGPFAVTEEVVEGETYAVFRDRRTAIIDLLTEAAATFGDHEHLCDEERRLTYADVLGAVGALAHRLLTEHGVRPGDRVGLDAANSVEWVVGFWAATAAGALPTLMNSYWSDPELSYALGLIEPALVLADERRTGQLATIADVAVIDLDATLLKGLLADPRPLPDVPRPDEDEPGLVMFTSGTTGRPKAIVHSHRSVIGAIQCNRFNTAVRMGRPMPPSPPPRVLVSPPLFHLSALYGAVLMFLTSGGCLIFRPGRFDEVRTMAAIEDEWVSVWLSVGSAAPRVATHADRGTYDLSSLRSIVVGGAPLSPAMKHGIAEAFPSAAAAGGLRMGYTSSEGGSIVASVGGDAFTGHPESTGPVQDCVQIAIRDDSGRDVAPGAEGEIHVRSPYTMLGYWRDPAATADVYRPGRWLAMGDVGRVEDGLLHVNSRARDLILVSAENVHPSEVENRLEDHPDVVESCVAGVEDPVTGQAVKAFVVLDPGAGTGREELAAWCRGGLAAYKVPTLWDLRGDRLPRNPAGKILRTALLAETEDIEKTEETVR